MWFSVWLPYRVTQPSTVYSMGHSSKMISSQKVTNVWKGLYLGFSIILGHCFKSGFPVRFCFCWVISSWNPVLLKAFWTVGEPLDGGSALPKIGTSWATLIQAVRGWGGRCPAYWLMGWPASFSSSPPTLLVIAILDVALRELHQHTGLQDTV